MERERLAAAGALACLLVVALWAAPYAVADPASVGVYYRVGIAGPPLIALFAAVAAIALAAGRQGRSDPALVAGVAVVLGAFVAALAWSWALSVTPSLVGGLTNVDAFRHHRWAFALASLAVPLAAGGYARAVVGR